MNSIYSKNIDRLISIVVPCYNSGTSLVKCVDSLLDQTYTNIEIIIVNDGSTCNETKKLINYYSKNKIIKIINQENKGLSAARNKGVASSSGKYVFFLDADDSVSNNCLKLLYEKIKNKKNYYSYPYLNLTGSKNALLKKNYNFFEELFTNQIPYSCLYPKFFFHKFGGFDENMKQGFEDWEFHIRLGKNNIKAICVAGKLFNYNVSEKGMLQSISLKKYYEIYEYIRKKHVSLYTLRNLYKIYIKNKKNKSTNNLKLYFLYYIYINIFPNKLLNKFLNFILIFSHASREQTKKNKNNSLQKVNKILHVLTSSDIGGAEKSLSSFISSNPSIENEVIILKYKNRNYLKFPDSKKITYLNMVPRRFSIFKFFIFYKLIKKSNPDVINSWLYHSDFLVSLATFFMFKKPKIIWSIHNNNLDTSIVGFPTKIIIFLCKLFSYFSPDMILCASKSSIKTHVDYGYNKKIIYFRPPIYFINNSNKDNKTILQNKLLSLKKKNPFMLGCLARWNIQKNQLFLLDCLHELKNEGFFFHLLMAGRDINYRNKLLVNYIKKKNLIKNITLLGEIKFIDKFFQKIDLNVLPSLSESFPLVITEAQCRYTPSLASDVGDVQNIIDNAGWVFKSNDKKSFKNKFKLAFQLFKKRNLWKQKCIASRKSYAIRLESIKKLSFF